MDGDSSSRAANPLRVARSGDSVKPVVTPTGWSSWREFPNRFVPLSAQEWQDANLKAYENNTEGLAVYTSNDEDGVRVCIDKLLPMGVRAIAFETYMGDYAPLYVSFVNHNNGYGNREQCESQWYKVIEYR